MSEKKEWWQRNAENLEIGAITIAFLAVILMVLYLLSFSLSGYLVGPISNLSPNNGGLLGDFIGGVIGTLFGGATVILVYLTYKSQKAELEATVKVATAQSLDNTFFNYLKLYISIVNVLKSKEDEIKKINIEGVGFYKKINNPEKGEWTYANDYFEILYRILNIRYKHLGEKPENFFNDNNWRIGHFLQSFISIVELVDESNIDESKKEFYCRVIKSTATSDELRLIFYFVIFNKVEKEKIRLKTMFKKLYFFDDLRDRDPLIKDEDWNIYQE